MNQKFLLAFCLIALKFSLALASASESPSSTEENVAEIIELSSQDFQHRSDGPLPNFLPRNPIPRVSNWLQRMIQDTEFELPGSRSLNLINRLSRSLGRRNPFAQRPKYPNQYQHQSQGQGQSPSPSAGSIDPSNDPEYLETYNDEELYAPSASYQNSHPNPKYQSNAISSWGEKTQYPNCGMDYTKFGQRCCWEEENYMRTQIKKEEEMGYVVDASSYYWDENRERCLKSVVETPMALMTDIEDPRVCKKRADCMWFADSGTCQCNPQYVGKRVYRGSSYKIYQPRGRW